MQLFKLLSRLKTYIICSLIFCSILSLFALVVNYKLKSSNIDYTIRDYASRTLNTSNYGLWRKIDINDKTLFNQNTGDAEFILKGDLKTLENTLFQKGFDKLVIHLHERIEISSTNASVRLVKGVYDIKKDSISFPLQAVEVRTIKADDFIEIKKCNIQGQMKLLWSVVNKRYQEHIFVESEDCPEFMLALKGSLLSESLKETQVLMHFTFSVIMIIAQVFSLILLDVGLQDNVMANKQLSTTTILFLGTLQLVLGFEQLVLSLFDFPYFFLMVLIGIFYFNLFFFLVLKTVASSVRYQIFYNMRNDPTFNIRSYLLFTYCKAHITILGVFLISLKLIDSPRLFMFWATAMTGQILKNTLSKTRFLSSQNHLTLFYLLTMIYALYMHFFKFNFFSVSNNDHTFDKGHCIKVAVFMFFQILIIICQQSIHPAFFIPERWRVIKSYDYFFEIDDLRNGKWKHKNHEQCIICFNSLDKNFKSSCNSDVNEIADIDKEVDVEKINAEKLAEENKIPEIKICEDDQNFEESFVLPSVTEESVANWRDAVNNDALREYLDTQIENKKFMGTPCDHVFHTSCMLVWMGQKMECPVCRRELPSIL